MERELLKNKLHALLLVPYALLVTVLDSDATILVLVSVIAVQMFFAKENWFLGGSYESQKSLRESIRGRPRAPLRKKP